MTAHPAAADRVGMERLIAQRRAAHLLTLDEGEREAEGNTIDGLDILPQLERLGISIGYRLPGASDRA